MIVFLNHEANVSFICQSLVARIVDASSQLDGRVEMLLRQPHMALHGTPLRLNQTAQVQMVRHEERQGPQSVQKLRPLGQVSYVGRGDDSL